jgi:hypothetical protein
VVRRALALGQVDTNLLKPLGDPEERLYPVVGEILGSWARTTRPRVTSDTARPRGVAAAVSYASMQTS